MVAGSKMLLSSATWWGVGEGGSSSAQNIGAGQGPADKHLMSCACSLPATFSNSPFSSKIVRRGRLGSTVSVMALSAKSCRALCNKAVSACSSAIEAAAPAMHDYSSMLGRGM